MGLAIDTVLYDVHNAATTAVGLTAGTVTNSGDAPQIRSFNPGAAAYLENVYLQGTTPPRRVRLISPRLHDNVTGVSFQALESPTEFLLPSELMQPLYSVDTITVQADAAASSDTVAALFNYYTDAPGLNADLRPWSAIKGRILGIKPVEVDVTSSATIGAWSDTVITTTENQLKANYEYAVLGFEVSANFLCVGIKGPATSNLRICVPGASPTLKLTDYFKHLEDLTTRPHIPVIQANDRGATFISVAANTASAAGNVFAILAWLA